MLKDLSQILTCKFFADITDKEVAKDVIEGLCSNSEEATNKRNQMIPREKFQRYQMKTKGMY